MWPTSSAGPDPTHTDIQSSDGRHSGARPSFIIIAVEEFWVKPVEEGYAEKRRSELELPEALEQELTPDSGQASPLRPAS